MRSSRRIRDGSALCFAAIALVGSSLGCEEQAPPTEPAPLVSAAPALASSAPPAALDASAEVAPFMVPTIVGATQVLVTYRGAELAPADVTRTREEAKARADEAYAKLMSGSVALDELVAKYADDPAAKAAGGRMGNFERYAMPQALGDAAFALAVGETSAVVETPRGFHILRRTK